MKHDKKKKSKKKKKNKISFFHEQQDFLCVFIWQVVFERLQEEIATLGRYHSVIQ